MKASAQLALRNELKCTVYHISQQSLHIITLTLSNYKEKTHEKDKYSSSPKDSIH